MNLIDERAVERNAVLVLQRDTVWMEAVQADPTMLPNFGYRTFLCPDLPRRCLAYALARVPRAALPR